MFTKRLLEIVAMMIIGDSIIGLTTPRRHVLLWRGGPKPWQRVVDSCARHTGLTRSIGLIGLAAGLWLALRQTSNLARPRKRMHGQTSGAHGLVERMAK